jgi:CheY-like chemotaxis protein
MTSETCQGCIMVVEDDPDLSEVLREHIEARLGCRVVLAVDGVDALSRLDGAEVVPPCLILADLNMPRLDGVGLARCIRSSERHGDTHIITMSADPRRARPAEAELHLDKPFAFADLAAIVGPRCRGGPARQRGPGSTPLPRPAVR